MVMIMIRVGMIVVPGFEVMSFAPLSVFDAANITLGEQRYEVRVLSETGGRTRNSFGMEIVTEPLGCTQFDTIVVAPAMTSARHHQASSRFSRTPRNQRGE